MDFFLQAAVSSIAFPGASGVAPVALAAAWRRIYFLHLNVHLLWRYRNKDYASLRRAGSRSLLRR
jgi:hypothetical protein